MEKKKSTYNLFLVSSILILSLVFGSLFLISQQILRLSANDPQIQLAEDTAALLNSGEQPSDTLSGEINIDHSLSPFTLITDKSGNVIAGNGFSSGTLENSIPYNTLVQSSGVPYLAVTWQPNKIRYATVAVSANNYFVFSGRSLTVVDQNQAKILRICEIAWGIGLFIILFSYIQLRAKQKTPKPKKEKRVKEVKLSKRQKSKQLNQEIKEMPQALETPNEININFENQEEPLQQENIIQQIEKPFIPQQPSYIQVRVDDENNNE